MDVWKFLLYAIAAVVGTIVAAACVRLIWLAVGAYKINRAGVVTTIASSLGRPQGLTFGPDGRLYVVDALAGSSGLHRLEADGAFTPIVAGAALVGVAYAADGTLVVASNETAYRFDS